MGGKEPGWKATGLLRPLWKKYPGGRDQLAKDVGTTGSVLSSCNTGKRNLGYDLGLRLAAALEVSLLELGAPESVADDTPSYTLADRLRELGEQVEFLLDSRQTLTKDLSDARTRIEQLERARKKPADDTKGRQATP